jgi:translation initiation factor 5B
LFNDNFFYSIIAGKGILTSAIATGVLGFLTTILFLFCIPDLDTFFALDAPQPFVQVYALALGKGPSIFMTIIAVIGLIMVRAPFSLFIAMFAFLTPSSHASQNSTIAVVASSRLLFAIARDGVLPLSGWIGRVDSHRQPRNAVTVMFVFAAVLLCSIIPSQVAFTSLISAGGVPTIAAYALIALLRLTCTPHSFKTSYFYLGRWARPMYLSTVLFNGLIFAVRSLRRPSSSFVFSNKIFWGLGLL